MDDMDFGDVLAGILLWSMVALSTLAWLIQRYFDSRRHNKGN